jgi:hypothetical protein
MGWFILLTTELALLLPPFHDMGSKAIFKATQHHLSLCYISTLSKGLNNELVFPQALINK